MKKHCAVVGGCVSVLLLTSVLLNGWQHPPGLLYLLPWLMIAPALERLPNVMNRLTLLGKDGHLGGCLDLAALHRACGYPALTSKLIRAFMHVQCILTGVALWRANAPGWVSIAALALLISLYLAWFHRSRANVMQSCRPAAHSAKS